MKFRALMGAATAAAMIATPVMASAAPANPAASLSLSPSVRAGATSAKKSNFEGAGIVGLVVGAGIIALVVIAATQKDNGLSAKSP